MNKGKSSTAIIVLIIAVLLNALIFFIVDKLGIEKINGFFQKHLNIEILETNALKDDNSKNTSEKKDINNNTLVASNLKIHYIDVGQGDAILLEQSGKYMLIDAGPTGSKSSLQKYLEDLNIKKIDYLVATHNHEDHIGGMANIIKNFEIVNLIMSKEISSTRTYENVILAAKEKKLKLYAPKVLEEFSLGEAKCIFLTNGDNDYSDANNHSIVIRVVFGNNSFMFMGDAEKELEKDILSLNVDISADILKLGHHGSNTSTSEEFLNKVNPKYAVVSCGKNNSYGHPCKSTMFNLKSSKIKVYRTDESSNIIVTSNGNNLSFNVQPGTYSYISAK